MARVKRFTTGVRVLDLNVKEAYKCKPSVPDQAALAALCALRSKGKVECKTKTPTEIGLEIEIEKVQELLGLHLWRFEPDGSLKDNGQELISSPISNHLLDYAMAEYEAFLKLNPKSVFSHRCSMHVHVNVSRLTVGQLVTLLGTYIVLEDLFFSLVPPERKGNSYCWPLADAYLNRRNIEPQNINEHFKYAAVNVHHLKDYGTIEFRQHGGSKDPKEILNWVETILQLYKFVENKNPSDVALLIKNLNTISNYHDFAAQVFEHKFPQFMNLPLDKMMHDNVIAAKFFLE